MDNLSAKTKAIIAYLTFIGTLIAFFINKDNKDEFTTWHIKNMFGLCLLYIITLTTQNYINAFVGEVLWYLSIVLWAFSLVMAILNKKKAIPYFSDKFQEWFTFLD